jgi:hypothetical protein
VFLTAQRVVSPLTAKSGINAFYYEHGSAWRVPPAGVPDLDPGKLVRESVEVLPPGNRIRSYLDFVGPDGITPAEIQQRFAMFLTRARESALPWAGIDGPCIFRVGIEEALAYGWRGEIAALLKVSLPLYR